MPSAVLTETRGTRFEIVLNRPEVKNALNLEALGQLIDALEAARGSDARVVVLRGAGGSFSSGGDIQDMLARRGKAVATFERLRSGLGRIVELITRHPKPLVARVDGDCVGAGCGIALACDFLLASPDARFGFPFPKVGLVPDTGTSWLVPHIVGIQQARRLLLTGDPLAAPEAASMGLVTELAADASGLDRLVDAWAEKLARLPPTALADAKRLFWQNLMQPLSAAVLNEALVQGLRFTSPEHAAAVDAFLARRKGA